MDPVGETIPASLSCPDCDTLLDISGFEPYARILCPHCTGELMVPALVDHFLLVKQIGQGSMGRVYLGIDQTLHRHVAVKVLRAKYGANPKMWSHLEREGKTAAALNHGNVVNIYRLGQQDGRPYIVMELVDNDRLDSVLEHRVLVDQAWVVHVGVQVMQGLEAARQIGLVHGDIKPANILFGRKDVVKVADFGLARFAEKEGAVEVWGTPYYIAPEKAKQESEDFRSDMYSLGATLFHVLTLHAPFEGADSQEVLRRALSEPTPSACALRADCPKALAQVLQRMMAKDPADRYPSYAAASQALEQALVQPDTGPERRKRRWPWCR